MGLIGRAVRRFGGQLIIDLAGLAGATAISYGAWLVYEPAGFIVGGTLLLAAAWIGARSSVAS